MNRARVLRLAILAAVIVALIVVRFTTSFGASLSTARIRDLVQHAGAVGVGLFIVAFAVGELPARGRRAAVARRRRWRGRQIVRRRRLRR